MDDRLAKRAPVRIALRWGLVLRQRLPMDRGKAGITRLAETMKMSLGDERLQEKSEQHRPGDSLPPESPHRDPGKLAGGPVHVAQSWSQQRTTVYDARKVCTTSPAPAVHPRLAG
jgi:hypothetical protein